MLEINIDKTVLLKRKELNKDKKKSEITIDLDEDLYLKLEKISEQLGISIEDIIIDSFYSFLLKETEKPEGIEEVIDSAILLSYMDKIFDSNKNYVLVDSTNFDSKSILITNKNMLENFGEL